MRTQSNSDPTTPNEPSPPLPGTPPVDPVKGTLTAILSFTQGLIPLLVAIVVLWYFGTTLKRMFGLTGSAIGEIEWGRNAFLYGGIEALAYAAAGFLFGREVNRQRAESAEANADKAQQIAQVSQNAAAVGLANGNALAESVRALDTAPGYRESAEYGAAGARADVATVRRIADALFPPNQIRRG
jgi:hypothetical protein